jgi:hypothetical protein
LGLHYERLIPTAKLFGADLQKISTYYSKLIAALEMQKKRG